ncbi:hypothetical protein [Pseudovibrio ascidiaceicola]|uniref:hypothetical protein n=1 Tax=Pseudovibrio ascidiaceicola TaxID=285279 RepID=UPI000D68A280|nr:hypothetical protein [Pseudovibrio ascidiaceicola]
MQIRLASHKDKEKILHFIRDHWKADHIFLRDPNFWSYEMTSNGKPNYILACDQNKVFGLLGFIPYEIAEPFAGDIALAMLKVREDMSTLGIGPKLLNFAKNLSNGEVHCVGIVDKALSMYTLLGYQTGHLQQYALINQSIDNYCIASVPRQYSQSLPEIFDGLEFSNFFPSKDEFEKIEQTEQRQKDFYFVKHRYYEHPKYFYKLTQIRLHGKIQALGVWRIVKHNNSCAIKLVDWFGCDVYLASLLRYLHDYSVKIKAEYVDCYTSCKRLENYILPVSQVKDLIVPNYFHPFVQKSVGISYATTAKNPHALFCGDGDQDRPS